MSPAHFLRTGRRSLAAVSVSPQIRHLQAATGIAASVLIATRNKASYLDLTLAALEQQVFPRCAWEVIVADEISQDATSDVLDQYEARRRLPLVRRHLATQDGNATARQSALTAARGTIVIFLKDDRLVGPDFVFQHCLAHSDGVCVALGDVRQRVHTHLFSLINFGMEGVSPQPLLGPEDLTDFDGLAGLIFEGGKDLRAFFDASSGAASTDPSAWLLFDAANASVAREQARMLGGFDSGFRACGIDEKELGYRLHRSGLPFRFAPAAAALQQHSPVELIKTATLAEEMRQLFRKHPELKGGQAEALLLRSYSILN